MGIHNTLIKGMFVRKEEDEGQCSTGITGLDEILTGGLPCHRMYSVQGQPGSGKTTFALQFLLEGSKRGEKTLYVTFSETIKELTKVAKSHGWSVDKITVMDLSSLENQFNPDKQNTLFHPAEIELNQVFNLVLERIKEVKPSRIVFDSVSEMRLLSETPLRYRRQILTLKQNLASMDITVLFLDDLTVTQQDFQIHSIAHGVVHLSMLDHDFGGVRRRLKVVKLRGLNFTGGYHDMEIQTGGIVVFPRMISSEHSKSFTEGALQSGSPQLDSLLGDGLEKGTASLFIGPAGTGKSSMIMKYVSSAVSKKHKVGYFCFDETIANLKKRSFSMGIDVSAMENKGMLKLQQVDPAEMSPGAFDWMIRGLVQNEGFEVIVIDSLNGYIHSMPQEKFLLLQLDELFVFLNNYGVVTMVALAQQGVIGSLVAPVDVTYLADTVILTRFFENKGAIKKAVSVVKKRTGNHEKTIREYSFGPTGIVVGPILKDFEGVLTGVPTVLLQKTVRAKGVNVRQKKKVVKKKK